MAKLTEWSGKLTALLKKYKYAVLVLLLGAALLLLPFGKNEKKQSAPTQTAEHDDTGEDYAARMEERLRQALMQIEGAGQVEVVLTLKRGSQTHYQTDVQRSEGESQKSEEQKTVILSEGSAYDKAAVSAVEYPQFQGALIVSEGAETAAVKLSLMQAVAALTGLSSDCITVVKMK